MESEEITKLVDGVYKNILEKFNPGARQLITAGKGYLKSLHGKSTISEIPINETLAMLPGAGAAAAARLFNETLSKIAMNAQHSGTNDIGVALLNVVSVYKEIQEQQMNILKAFYVDLLVPLETNLEKDTKVVQHEQKKFMQQHKIRMDSYQKAMATMKKQRKKKASPENTEKELRNLQLLEEQKKKLDLFCEQSYKNAMQQERRRYGFVLERQCSIAKHWIAYHTTGKSILINNIENWQDVANSREFLPSSVQNDSNGNAFQMGGNKRLERLRDSDDMPELIGNSNQLKKSRSIDAPYGDMRTMHELNAFNHHAQNSLPRAKSDFNLNSTAAHQSAVPSLDDDDVDNGHWDQRIVVKALYAYMPSGENQVMLEEGDRIALVGGKAKGWQFGENLRTQMFGWFPTSYTNSEFIQDNKSIKMERERNERSQQNRYDPVHYERNNNATMRSSYPEQIYQNNRDLQQQQNRRSSSHHHHQQQQQQHHHSQRQEADNELESDTTYRRDRTDETSPTRMFGDTYRQQKKYRPLTNGNNPRPGPPPLQPAPVPSLQNSNRQLNASQSFCASNGANSVIERRKQKLQNGGQQPSNQHSSVNQMKTNGPISNGPTSTAAKTSLHSSNDSGFANEPPPQPEIDYSDDEQTNNRVPIRRRTDSNALNVTNKNHEPSINSWTLNRNIHKTADNQLEENGNEFQTLNRSSKRYDLVASDDELLHSNHTGLKRTKSFWKFGSSGGRGDDILAGMSMWQHRDLVTTPHNGEETRDEGYRTTSSKMESEREMDKNDTLTKSNSLHFTVRANPEARSPPVRRDSASSIEMYDDDENIYGMTPIVREIPPQVSPIKSSTGFTPKSRMKIMKTIEIDIENPTDNTEQFSTMKRGHKGYRESTMIQQQQQPFNNNNRSIMEMKHHRSNSSSNYKKSYDTKNQHNPTSPSRNHKPDEVCPSTESEANESELDNGTLKMSDVNNFFDTNANGVGIIMKTVKRKDILKQYYSSEDESDEHDLKSTSSDPYDCIVINDHLVRGGDKHKRDLQMQEHQMEFQTFRAAATTTTTHKNKSNNNNNSKQNNENEMMVEKNRSKNRKSTYDASDQERYMNNSTARHTNNVINNTPTATILPRTRLMKSSASSMTLERSSTINSAQKSRNKPMSAANSIVGDKQQQQQQQQQQHYNKTYGPWYDFWDQQDMSSTSNKRHHKSSANKM